MTQTLNRRAIIGALTSAAVAGTVPAIAATENHVHASDCATNNGPALEPGECDCGLDDPFIVAFTIFREACAVRNAAEAEADYDALHDKAYDAFLDALGTDATTIQGHAVKLEFLAEKNTCHWGMVCAVGYIEEPIDEDYMQESVRETLVSAAEMMRRLPSIPA
jgi:hypothetical protein